jgi:hypothetical protein
VAFFAAILKVWPAFGRTEEEHPMKKLILGAVLAAAVTTVQAEPLRTLYTTENQMPEKGQLELGALVQTWQYENKGDYREELYVRYGLFGNLAAYAFAPMMQIRPKTGFGNSENGFSDCGIGLKLVAYEDIFRFPYILPHLELRFPTGDEEKGLGTGEVAIKGGVTVGTKTWECVDWALDVSGQHLATTSTLLKSDTVIISGSIIWTLPGDQLSLVSEVSGSDQSHPDGNPLTFSGGMVFKPTENLMFGLFGGKTTKTDESWNGTFKMAYSF